MKRLTLFVVAVVFAFVTTVMAVENPVALTVKDAAKADLKKDVADKTAAAEKKAADKKAAAAKKIADKKAAAKKKIADEKAAAEKKAADKVEGAIPPALK
jgi:hypothetical protein